MSSIREQIRRDHEEGLERAKPHWDRFEEYAQRLGDTARAFSFAGLALVWIFRRNIDNQVVVPPDLAVAGFFFIASLSAELLRLFFGALEGMHFGNTAYLGSAGHRAYKAVWEFLGRFRPSEIFVLLEAGLLAIGFVFALRFLLSVIRTGG